MPVREMLLPEFEEEMKNTRKMLERVPTDKLDYKPHEKSMKLGNLAMHVAEIAGWGHTTLETELLDIPMDYKPTEVHSREQILEVFDKGVAKARDLMSKASDEDLAKMWTLRWGGKDVFSLPRLTVWRSMVMNHTVHHRAQLSVYLRLNNVEIPGMYGPSGDEMQAMTAAQQA